ncbi:MAG TPA: tetratricopeptide repeat protein [Acidobacteriaceae bacterium]|jgi:Flp pilus assembly protein TadD|nr:tetratricopeptide repeat protein [Acidobacteriaceae bacterium]
MAVCRRALRGVAALGLTALSCWAQGGSAYERGHAAFDAQKYTEAAPLFAQAAKEQPQSDALLFEGKALANVERYTEADSALRAYAVQHPNSPDALYMLGFVLNREDRPADSLKAYTRAAQLSSPKSDDLKVVAMDYVLLNDYPDAIRWMRQAVAFDPQNEQAWYGLGRCYYSQSEFKEAQQAFEKALGLAPQDVKAEENLGLAYEMGNRPQDAERAYKAAIALANGEAATDQWPYLDYGSFLLEHDRSAEAVPVLERAVKAAPQCADCHGKLGRALARTGHATEGIAELRVAVQLAPKDPRLHYDLGRAYRAAGKMDEARAELAVSAQLYGAKGRQ